jgi:O-succinylbenzoate synthase
MSVELAYFELPFRSPYKIGGKSLSARRGVMIRVKHGRRVGHGEVAPLPGAHRETLDEAVASLMEGIKNSTSPMMPSAAFGLSCAHESAAASARYGLAGAPKANDIGINALFNGSAEEAKAAIEAGVFAGYATVKLKIGRARRAEDHRLIQTALDLLPAHVRLRLDGNRSMSLAGLVGLLKDVDARRIEYLEEPLRNYADLCELSRRSQVSVAIDESLYDAQALEHVLGAPGIDVQVVRPSLMGSLEEVEAVITRGRINGMDTVLSTALESSYTIALVARLATVMEVGDRDHGLATAGLLATDLVEPAPIVAGRMTLAKTLPVPRLEFVAADRFTLPQQARS